MTVYRFTLSATITCLLTVCATPAAWAQKSEFTKTYRGATFNFVADAIPRGDGGYLAVGHADGRKGKVFDGWVMALDAEGVVQWEKKIGGDQADILRKVSPHPKGGFVAVGQTKSRGNGHYDIWIARLDDEGNVLWQKTYGGQHEDRGQGLAVFDDGSIVVAGTIKVVPKKKEQGLLVRLDPDGRERWKLEIDRAAITTLADVSMTGDDSVLVLGRAGTRSSTKGWIARYDGAGTQERSIKLQDGYPQAIQALADGGFVVAGSISHRSSMGVDAWITRFNADWTVRWDKNYGTIKNDSADGIALLANGDFLLAGEFNSFGAGGSDIMLLRVNERGQMVWSGRIGTKDYEFSSSVHPLPEGGVVVGGAQGGGKLRAGLISAVLAKSIVGKVPAALKPADIASLRTACETETDKGQRLFACVKLAKQIPMDAPLYLARGKAHALNRAKPFALADYADAIRLKPDYYEAYLERGRLHERNGKKTEAVADYSKAISLRQDRAAPYAARGLIYRRQKKLKQALADYDMAVKLSPGNADYLNQRGNITSGLGNKQQAIRDYTAAFAANPKLAVAITNRAAVYAGLGQFERALEDNATAIRVAPKSSSVYEARAETYRAMKKYALAIEDHGRAIRLDPNDEWRYLERAKTYDLMGDKIRADADRRRAEDIEADMWLGLIQ